MVETGIFLKQLTLTCSLIVFTAVIIAVTGVTLNAITRTFLYVWKKMPNIGKELDKLSQARLNSRVAPKRKRVPAKKASKPVTVIRPAAAKQGVQHV